MHELSIAMSLVDLACEEASRMPAGKVAALRIRVGALSGVVKDALLFSFDAAAAGTAIEGARLEIEESPAAVWCARCGAERELTSVLRRRCPVCDAPAPDLVRGEELALVSMEIADADPDR
jgi:hydrogenase nickel incorporation protein HypA/HybF